PERGVESGHGALDQRALARPGDAGDDHEGTERDVDVHVLQVVGVGAAHLQGPRRRADRVLEPGPVVEVTAGDRVAPAQALDRALLDPPPATGAGPGPLR